MASGVEGIGRVGFGLFEADLQAGELLKAGRKIKLQSQPFKILTVLLEHPGEVVSREELQLLLWGKNTVVDFDHSLGTAINKIREALGDSADNPRFVETLARRGYRFIAPVAVLSGRPALEAPAAPLFLTSAELAGAPVETLEASEIAELPPASRTESAVLLTGHPQTDRPRVGRLALLVGGVVIALLASAAGFRAGSKRAGPLPRIQRLTRTGRIAPGLPEMESLSASASDGLRVFTQVIADGRSLLAQVDVHTGAVQSLPVPSEIASPSLGDLSPDGSKLLLRSHLSPESEQPLWIVPTSGGSALRIANAVAHDATWMPDGNSVLYAAGNQLAIIRLRDGTSTPFATVPGRAFWLRWSPDGKLLRFTLLDPIGHTSRLWEIESDGKGARAVLNGWTKPSSECCGVWTGDGKYFVFQSNRPGNSDLWRLDGKSISDPVRVTNGPLSFEAPVTSRIGHRIIFLGLETQSVLQRRPVLVG